VNGRRAFAGLALVAALILGAVAWRLHREPARPSIPARPAITHFGGDRAALDRLRTVPLFRALVESKAVRSGTLDGDGTVRVEVDIRALAQPRLTSWGIGGAAELLPSAANGIIHIDPVHGDAPAVVTRESWEISGPSPLLDLLDRGEGSEDGTRIWDAIPGSPSAVVRVRLNPARLTDPALFGQAFGSWRDRIELAEKLLGRPIRAEISEDLAGPAVFALYEVSPSADAEALAAFELKRADRIAGLLDMLFGLGALTERATVSRYRGVATGSFTPAAGGPGVALAVDGESFLVASSRGRLEALIDARRAPLSTGGLPFDAAAADASWRAVSRSAFVTRGWARLARVADGTKGDADLLATTLVPEGTDRWRLDGSGPAPAITAEPVIPFLRSVLARRQRDGD
jgi:hypothetical protein